MLMFTDPRKAELLEEFRHAAAVMETAWPVIAARAAEQGPTALEIFPDEGLTFILNGFPRAQGTAAQGNPPPTTLYMGVFTAQTASTVPPRGQVLGSTPPVSGVTEPTNATGGYARTSVANTAWGAAAVSGTGVRSTATQVSFAESTAAWSPSTVNGFFLASQLAQGTGSIAMFYANFDDNTAVNINAAGYTLRVTPFWHYDG